MVKYVIIVCTAEILVPLGKQDLHLCPPAALDLPKSRFDKFNIFLSLLFWRGWGGGLGAAYILRP